MTEKHEWRSNRPNPALASFGSVIGAWRTTGTHPLIPGRIFHGRAVFEWIEGGAFLALHTEMEGADIPSGVALIGSDDAAGTFYMIYFDERGVSRKYDVTVGDLTWSWARETPGFSQRFVLTLAADGLTMLGQGRMSRDGGPWEDDLQLRYVRAEAPA